MSETSPLRVANCSGFYGDRFTAAREMVEGGPIDVLTGDYLAELTMAILWRSRTKDPSRGYASSFVRQMEEILGTCVDRGIRVVANAGGLNPGGLAARLSDIAERLGIDLSIGVVTGDDVLARLDELRGGDAGALASLDTNRPFDEIAPKVLTANAYLGGWGIAAALDAGADIVVTGRVADAALVSGPAAHHFGWATDDWDALAGATVAGHVVECGAQCTGGNYPFFDEIPRPERPGFPIAEIRADGSAVVTKHPDTGGAVTVGTVTAQLLYEIGPPAYVTPDVVAHFDTIALDEAGPDRVRISGVRGSPAPDTAKVGIVYLGGYRNEMTLLVPPPLVAEKAELVERQLRNALPDGVHLHTDLLPADPTADRRASGVARCRVVVTSDDPSLVGRAFSSAAVELALASYPGFTPTAPPTDGSPFTGFWPTLIPASAVASSAEVDGAPVDVPVPTRSAAPTVSATPGDEIDPEPPCGAVVAFGTIVGARSGDKGADANLGVWARHPRLYPWLERHLTVARLVRMLPELEGLAIERYPMPNLTAINFVIRELLGEGGVAASNEVDPQAKTLAEFLRSRPVEVPLSLLEET